MTATFQKCGCVRSGRSGFTLIEIIAVLVILGVLAAIAVPKYFSLQAQAQASAVQGALGALTSHVSQDYAAQLLAGTASSTAYTPSSSVATAAIGDFTGSISNAGGVITCVVTAGPSWFASSTATKTKTFQLY